MSSQHVLIVGAGVCGLAIGHGLQNPGIPFTIFEAEEKSAFRPREWTMALHWSIPMLESLLPDDLAARLKVDAVVDKSLDYAKYPNNVISIFDGVSGQLATEIPSEGLCLRVSRRKIRALCSEGIEVQYGHTLENISYSSSGTVTASFTNGNQHTGTLLIGADGPRSCVRRQLFGADKATATTLDVMYSNTAFRYPDAEKSRFARSANPISSIMVHPDCIGFVSIQDVPDPERPETWRFQVVVCWKGSRQSGLSNREKHRVLKEKVQNLKEPHRTAILNMPSEVEIQFNDLACWGPQPWDAHSGRVTLAGDAAHSMPPHRGQGLNNAINDAYNLVEAIKKIAAGEGDQAELIQACGNEIAERGAKEVNLSRDTAFLMLDYEKFKDSALMRHGLARMPEAGGE